MVARIGESLVQAGVITPDQLDQAIAHQRLHGLRLGECLHDLGFVAERELLAHLATRLKVRFVTAGKLLDANVSDEALERLPVRLAERQTVVPVRFDPVAQELTVATPAPQDVGLLAELSETCKVSSVVSILALAPVVRAAIRMSYYSDRSALAALAAGKVGASTDGPSPSDEQFGEADLGPTIVRKRPEREVAAPPPLSPQAVAAAVGGTVDPSNVEDVAARILAAIVAADPKTDPVAAAERARAFAAEFCRMAPARRDDA